MYIIFECFYYLGMLIFSFIGLANFTPLLEKFNFLSFFVINNPITITQYFCYMIMYFAAIEFIFCAVILLTRLISFIHFVITDKESKSL